MNESMLAFARSPKDSLISQVGDQPELHSQTPSQNNKPKHKLK